MKSYIPYCVAAVIIILPRRVETGKCKCVDYDRDWYVIVTSFASGLLLSAVLVFLFNCCCRRCGRTSPRSLAPESQETVEEHQQPHGDSNPLYEEVPEGDNNGFEAIGGFDQPLRSDHLMNSWTNLVVRHGYPSEQQDYQYPSIEMENISSNCGEDIGQMKTDEEDGTKHGEFRNTSGYQAPTTKLVHVSNESIQLSSALKESSFEDKNKETLASDYRHPKLDNTYTDMSMQKNVNVPSKFKDTLTIDQVKDNDKNSTLSNHQHPSHMCSNTALKQEIHSMSESEATSSDYNNSTSVDSLNQDMVATDFGESSLTDQVNNVTEASEPGNYQHSNPHQTCSNGQKENTQNPELPPRSRTFPKTQPAIHVTSDKTSPVAPLKPPRYSKPSRSLLPRKNIKTPIKSEEETLTKNRPALQHPVTSCSKTASPEIDNYSKENKAVPNLTKETVSPITLKLPEKNSQALLSKPQLDGITSQDKSLAVEKCTKASEESRDNTTSIFTDLSKYQTPSTSEEETKCNSDYQLPVIDKEFLETEGTSGENDSITTDEDARSSFEQPSSTHEEQNRDSRYQIPDIDIKFFQTEHKALNPLTSYLPQRLQKSSFTRASMPPVSSEPPTLPLTESLQRSLSATEFLSPSRPPPLPSKKPSLKSSKIVSSLPPIPPKKTPKLLAKTKLVSPKTSSAFYTELNQLDRKDDVANYGHLHSTTKQ